MLLTSSTLIGSDLRQKVAALVGGMARSLNGSYPDLTSVPATNVVARLTAITPAATASSLVAAASNGQPESPPAGPIVRSGNDAQVRRSCRNRSSARRKREIEIGDGGWIVHGCIQGKHLKRIQSRSQISERHVEQ
jgi:hypothetical protein